MGENMTTLKKLELTVAQAEILCYMVEDWYAGITPNREELKRDLECTEKDIEKVYELVTDLLD